MENTETNINLEEVKNAAIIFARALSFIFQDNEGIVIDVPETIRESFQTQRVVILKTNDKVSIFNYDNLDLPEGTSVSLSEEENNK